ncbi:MAG: hypothetical protein V9E99_02875 [Microthrixaceae bacterium]|jgi:hypothetical protein
MAKAKRKPTWLEVAIHYAGMRDAIKAMSYAYCWAVVREASGEDPSAEDIAKWWNQSERTTYREQAAFRKALPMLDTPALIYATEESRESIRRMIGLADQVEEWGKECRARREQDGVKAFVLGATVPMQ